MRTSSSRFPGPPSKEGKYHENKRRKSKRRNLVHLTVAKHVRNIDDQGCYGAASHYYHQIFELGIFHSGSRVCVSMHGKAINNIRGSATANPADDSSCWTGKCTKSRAPRGSLGNSVTSGSTSKGPSYSRIAAIAAINNTDLIETQFLNAVSKDCVTIHINHKFSALLLSRPRMTAQPRASSPGAARFHPGVT